MATLNQTLACEFHQCNFDADAKVDVSSNESKPGSKRFAKIEYLSAWIPETNPDHPRAQTFLRRLTDRSRMLATQQIVASLVLVANTTWVTWALSKFGTSLGIGTMYVGSCVTAKRLNVWLHLLINILSTLLLGASNYCMQLFVGPTRHEVDVAHRKKNWLHIGVSSIKNLRQISAMSVVTWCCFGCSSALLHLL